MKVLIVVHDLVPHKAHLMPWRTCCEVVWRLIENGVEARLLSVGEYKSKLRGDGIPPGSRQIRKSGGWFNRDLSEYLREYRPDVVFWPVSWRERKDRLNVVAGFKIPVVVWFPGGVYTLRSCVQALKVMKLRDILPYFFEVISNKESRVRFFKKIGVKAVLTMTHKTGQSAIERGWSRNATFVIPPGKDKMSASHTAGIPGHVHDWLQGKPFYLFMGPPSGIRGVYGLLDAFDVAASQEKEMRLICLFRSDGKLDSESIKSRISSMRYSNRILSFWDSLSKKEIGAYLSACHAVVMPFVFVPSEIPLAIIEVMSYGKPVITTRGGSGEFVSEFGLTVEVGDKKELAKAMEMLVRDRKLYEEKTKSAQRKCNAHPGWDEVATAWLSIAEYAVRS